MNPSRQVECSKICWALWIAIWTISASISAFGQSDKQARFQSLLENNLVAVYALDLAPRFSAPIYQSAHDTFWIALDDASITFIRNQETGTDVQFKAGDTRFFSSFETKSVVNHGRTVFRGVLVVIKPRGLASYGCGCSGEVQRSVCGCADSGHLGDLWALSMGDITVARTTLSTSQSFRAAAFRNDMLLIALTDLQLQDQAAEHSEVVGLEPGEVRWIKSGRHQFKNVGPAVARFVTFEFY